MRHCSVELELQNQNGNEGFEIGDDVDLILNFDVHEHVRCEGIKIDLCWETQGRGRFDSGSHASTSISAQEFEPGEYEFKKSFTIPDGPTTFHGYYINLDWRLEVTISGPPGKVLKKEILFTVDKKKKTPLPENSESIFTESRSLTPSFPFLKVGSFFFALIFLLLTLGSAALDYPKFAMFGGFFSVFLVGFFWIQKSQKNPFREFRFEIQSSELRTGQPLKVGLTFFSEIKTSIKDVEVNLIGYEVVNRRTLSPFEKYPVFNKRESYRESFPISGPLDTVKNQINRTEKEISIPANIPPSFALENNRLEWFLELRLRADGHEDRVQTLGVTVI